MEVIELTKALISCQSVTPKNDGVLDLLEKELSNIGLIAGDIYLAKVIRLM